MKVKVNRIAIRVGCVLFSVFKIPISTFTHSCSLVRKAENCFWIKNNSKIEVAPKRQSFTIIALVWVPLPFILLTATFEVFVVEKWFIPFWIGNFMLVKLKCSTNMQIKYYWRYTYSRKVKVMAFLHQFWLFKDLETLFCYVFDFSVLLCAAYDSDL